MAEELEHAAAVKLDSGLVGPCWRLVLLRGKKEAENQGRGFSINYFDFSTAGPWQSF